MRTTAMPLPTRTAPALPRGWIVLGAALASWLVVAVMWTGMSQFVSLISAAA